MGLASGCSVHGSCLSGGFHLPSLVAVLCSAVAVSQGCPGCLHDTSSSPSLRNTSSSTSDLISSWCSDYEQPGKPPAIDCPEVPSLHHVEVRVVAGQSVQLWEQNPKCLQPITHKPTARQSKQTKSWRLICGITSTRPTAIRYNYYQWHSWQSTSTDQTQQRNHYSLPILDNTQTSECLAELHQTQRKHSNITSSYNKHTQ